MSVATTNGIVSAAGAPEQTQSVSYSIEGETGSTATSLPLPSKSSATDGSLISGSDTTLATGNDQHRLSTGAIVGISMAVILAVGAIIGGVIILHKKRGPAAARAKRKSIMDMEFAAASTYNVNTKGLDNGTMTKEPKVGLHRIETNQSAVTITTSPTAKIGYFDVAKPLPAVIADPEPEPQPQSETKPDTEVDPNRLSRSSTIIGDAAEVAQINRKASQHHNSRRERAARDAVRERNHALQILITNEDNDTSILAGSPVAEVTSPRTPVNGSFDPQGHSHGDNEANGNQQCTDGDGDTFAKRPSKI